MKPGHIFILVIVSLLASLGLVSTLPFLWSDISTNAERVEGFIDLGLIVFSLLCVIGLVEGEERSHEDFSDIEAFLAFKEMSSIDQLLRYVAFQIYNLELGKEERSQLIRELRTLKSVYSQGHTFNTVGIRELFSEKSQRIIELAHEFCQKEFQGFSDIPWYGFCDTLEEEGEDAFSF